MPPVVGAPVDQARRALEQQGFRTVIADREAHPTYPLGVVTWQDPAAGVAAPRGSPVNLTVSEGPGRHVVPDVHGLDADLARRLLTAAGVTVGGVDTVASPYPAGVAAGTAPAAGDTVPAGGRVTLHLAKGTS